MTMNVTDWIVLGLVCVSVIISIVWQIRMTRRNRAAEQAKKPEHTEETV